MYSRILYIRVPSNSLKGFDWKAHFTTSQLGPLIAYIPLAIVEKVKFVNKTKMDIYNNNYYFNSSEIDIRISEQAYF